LEVHLCPLSMVLLKLGELYIWYSIYFYLFALYLTLIY
jgi:hypothetical protein